MRRCCHWTCETALNRYTSQYTPKCLDILKAHVHKSATTWWSWFSLMPGIHYTHALMLFRSTSISWIGYECRVHNLTIIMKVIITYQWQFFPFQYLTFTKRYFNNFWKLLFTIELVGNSILRLRRVSWEYLSQGEIGEGGFSGKGGLLRISFSLDSTSLSPIWMSDLIHVRNVFASQRILSFSCF